MKFETLKTNLSLFEGLDRISYIVDLAKKNDGIPDNLKTDDNRILGCVSTSYVILDSVDPVKIKTDSESMLVKGLLYVLNIYVNGKTKNEILIIDEVKLMNDIGMTNTVTAQRMNGFYSAIVTLKKLVKYIGNKRIENINKAHVWKVE
jgi:cysteine desulfuration protein SufE|tara:strand:- start:1496 stop:1939 length:444 start_codon:yes stop_codon:yes gene_type:complete